jgi:uncharacterized protein YpmS
MTFNKLLIFKILFLMMLSLKIAHVVYQNISQLSSTEEISYILDIDESEEEEKNEFDESVKINQRTITFSTFSFLKKPKYHSITLLKRKVLPKEFTTQPPRLG